MTTMRILVKLAGAAQPRRALTLAATGAQATLHPLFSVPAPAGMGLAAGPRVHTWHALEVPGGGMGIAAGHRWDMAHTILRQQLGDAGTVIDAEPDIQQSWGWQDAPPAGPGLASAAPVDCSPQDQNPDSHYQRGQGFGWHLGDDKSGLRTARLSVDASDITIVHLDTGYDPDHRALPPNLDRDRQRNFIADEAAEHGNDAADRTPTGGLLHNRGHGTGTIGILAGGDVADLQAKPVPPNGFGSIGGAPDARIVPVRVANSVVHFWTSAVASGINYAREIGADVLSMSMGGLPSSAWADAVNMAYDAGVVLVCAAGNSFLGLPTSLIVYPARFQRVIAACGIMAGGKPYYGLGGPMEGNAGPASKMMTAMAAYTPNIPWLRLGCADVVDMDGNGTSSATPQIAAAAALWLARHGAQFPRGSWQRVEAVRAALFAAADRHGRAAGDGPDPYFGQGSLRAAEALKDAYVPDINALHKTDPDSAAFGFLHLLSSVFGVADARPVETGMLQLELTQLALTSRAARQALPDPGMSAEQITPQQRRHLFEAILDDAQTSSLLRRRLETLLGRTQVISHSNEPATDEAARATSTGSGAEVMRRTIIMQPPTRRRLRVFATDPIDSSRLQTSFINTATIEIPWEENLRPGPVGQYLEVVDVDPASNAAYDPVDLSHAYLLGQDGHAPSEGNPQFHQQMAYAVAMRTIRNFEVALGRRVLWSERRMPDDAQGGFVPAPDGGYVQRLRIYPHAMREQNAYYDPGKKALLFGYFPIGMGNKHRTVFTCLSHDIVAHETTHAILDGLHPYYQEDTNPDVLAFHEAFADIVAIFQHFTLPELLRFEIARLRGDLSQASILSDLARQFGQSLHNARALRRALDRSEPRRRRADPTSGADDAPPLRQYSDAQEPHERGAILVAAVFEAFVAIYQRRTADLMRLATGGSGILRPGAIPAELVDRLANTAADTAQRVLTLCLRAVDYMPPVDPTFGDFLRAVVTADADLAPDHGEGYRVAFAEAFNARGIYPPDITSVGPDALRWQPPDGGVQRSGLGQFMRGLELEAYSQNNRQETFVAAKRNAAALHDWLAHNLDANMARSLGLDFSLRWDDGRPRFTVHSVRPARRMTAEGEPRTDVVAILTQRRDLPLDPANPDAGSFPFRGGTTLLVSREIDGAPVRYAISRPVSSEPRQGRMRQYQQERYGYQALYKPQPPDDSGSPFALLHRGL